MLISQFASARYQSGRNGLIAGPRAAGIEIRSADEKFAKQQALHQNQWQNSVGDAMSVAVNQNKGLVSQALADRF